jgi:hypothetical protein
MHVASAKVKDRFAGVTDFSHFGSPYSVQALLYGIPFSPRPNGIVTIERGKLCIGNRTKLSGVRTAGHSEQKSACSQLGETFPGAPRVQDFPLAVNFCGKRKLLSSVAVPVFFVTKTETGLASV